VTAGTVFDRSRIPLTEWFAAAWYMTNQKHGVSALGLQRLLGLGSYQTAWTMLQKLRTAMVRPGRDRLHGLVEVDEAYVGGIEQGVRGRGTKNKFIVAIAVEVLSPQGFGRIRLGRVDDVSGASLVPFVSAAVEPDTEVRTDGWKGYNGLSGQRGTDTTPSTSLPAGIRPTSPCLRYIAWPPCSNAGCSALIRARSLQSIWMPISTNSPSASIAATPDAAVCSFCGSWNMPWSPRRPGTDLRAPIARHETTTSSGHCTQAATPLDLKRSMAKVWLVGPGVTDLEKNNLASVQLLIFQPLESAPGGIRAS
jgi:transposase-like protein